MIQLPTIWPVTSHTEFVGPGSTFVAIKGFSDDGVRYIDHAIDKGATTIVVGVDAILSSELLNLIEAKNIKLQRVQNTRIALAQLSAQAAGFPAHNLSILAITGTKGKTTTAYLLHEILRGNNYKTALISSVENKINNVSFSAPLTTPQPDYLHQFFKVCVSQGVTHIVMEVAAQAATLHRIEGLQFDALVFTNFSREHLEFYSTIGDYFAAKKAIVAQVKEGAPLLVNGDEPSLNNIHPNALYFSLQRSDIEYRGRCFSTFPLSISVRTTQHQESFDLSLLVGEYNGYNLVAAISLADKLNISLEASKKALCNFKGVPGRFEQYTLPNSARAIIDCAHNLSSFQAIFSTVRPLSDHIIAIFGAGGDRDAGRRPQMGAIAAKFADIIILTTDNPRSENVHNIIAQIQEGIPTEFKHKVLIEVDREKAIKLGYGLAHSSSLLLLLGKGTGEYQIVGNQKIPFNERVILAAL